MNHEPSSPGLVICTHPDFPGLSFDFRDLWHGAPDEIKGYGAQKWKGGFRARPALADAIWPSLTLWLRGKSPEAFRRVRYGLREFWRFLDGYVRAGFQRVERLEDIQPELGLLWQRPAGSQWPTVSRKSAYVFIGTLIKLTRRAKHGAQDIYLWPSFQAHGTGDVKDLPEERGIRNALTMLKHDAYAIYARWNAADRLASEGRNLLRLSSTTVKQLAHEGSITVADAHATYRAVAKRIGNPLPSAGDVARQLGHQSETFPWWWPKHADTSDAPGKKVTLRELREGLYPTIHDIDCLSQLVMARTGWNPSTVLDLDITSANWARPHGDPDANLWIIESFKKRSGTWQWTVSTGKLTTGPYHIVKTLLARTAALRECVRQNPTCCDVPLVALRSPWIAAGLGHDGGRVLVRHTFLLGPMSMSWRTMVHAYNADAPDHRKVPLHLTPSDWRDIFVGHVFPDSRYSWTMVQWALGHRHVSSTRHYLRKALWKRYSEKTLGALQTLVADEVEVHARFDPTVLRANLEFGYTCKDSDIERLKKYREATESTTYCGYHCPSPQEPPKEIDPSNPQDGTTTCARSERCPGCPIAMAFDAVHMTKRLVELRWLRRNVSATVWLESPYATDLDALLRDLGQWPAEEVEQWVTHWEEQIASGKHRVLRFGGYQ